MKNIKKLAVLLLLVSGLQACNEDKGNYDYTPVNAVALDSLGIADIYYVSLGDTLTITPRLVYSLGSDLGQFTYKWYYNETGWKLIEEGRTFKQEIASPIGKSSQLAFEVTNTRTGVNYRRLFKLNVTNPLATGLVALTEKEDGFDLDIITYLKTKDQFRLQTDILEMLGSTLPHKGVKPIAIDGGPENTAPEPYNAGPLYGFYVLTDQYATRLKSDDYSYSDAYDLSKITQANSYLDVTYTQKGKKITPDKIFFSLNPMSGGEWHRTWIYDVNDAGEGNWLVQSSYPWRFFFGQIINRYEAGGVSTRFTPAPYAALGRQYGGLLYDRDNKQFVFTNIHSSTSDLTLKDRNNSKALEEKEAGGAFSFADPAYKDLFYMDVRQRPGSQQDGYAILEQTDGTYKYIEFGFSSSAAGMVAVANRKYASTFAAGSRIGEAKFIVAAPYTMTENPYLYYVTNDNQIYKADISNNNAVVTNITSQIITDGYTEVTAFRVLLPQASSGYIPSALERSLAIATCNPALDKEVSGKLSLYLLQGGKTGNLELVKYPSDAALQSNPREDGYQVTFSFTGLGKIVSLVYKQF